MKDYTWVRPYRLVGLLAVLRFYAHSFVQLSSMLTSVSKITESLDKPQEAVHQSTFDLFNQEGGQFLQAQKACKEMGLNLSCLLMEATMDGMLKMTYAELGRRLQEIKDRIRDELSLCLLIHIPADKKSLYENSDPFGAKVTASFSSAAYDIEEASKCLALDRSTACVMHLMRVLETAIDAIALGVGVKVVAVKAVAAWEQLLNMIRDAIQANNKASAPPWTAARPFFESVYAYLHAVKDAWRNPAIHDAEQKYTPDEAERIYTAIKNLMSHLAEHLKEDGEFSR